MKRCLHLLSLQEKNIATYLKTVRLPENQKILLLNLGKTLYQVCLMTKSTIAFWKNFSESQLYSAEYPAAWTKIIEDMINATLVQLKNKKLPDFTMAKNKLMSYRENLTEMRKLELNKLEPDFFVFLEYTCYFYHHIKLLELLETTSRIIDQLKGSDV